MKRSMKKRSLVKLATCAAFAGIVAASLSACGTNEAKPDTSTPTGVVESALQALKSKDVEALDNFYDGDVAGFKDMPATLQEYGVEQSVEGGSEAANALVDKLLDFDYKVDNETIDGEFATVDVEFDTFDIGKVVTNVLDTTYGTSLDDVIANSMGENEQAKKLADTIASELSNLTEKGIEGKGTVDLTMENGKWVIDDMSGNFEFINAITGGAPEALEKWSEKLVGKADTSTQAASEESAKAEIKEAKSQESAPEGENGDETENAEGEQADDESVEKSE